MNEIIQMRPELFKDPDSFFTYPSAMNTLSINELFTKNAKPESIYAFLVQTGYMLNGKVIRFAKVVVGI